MPAPAVVRRWLQLCSERVDARSEELTLLDAAIGDGDHGINLRRGFTAVVDRLAGESPGTDGAGPEPGASAADLLAMTGRTLVSTVGGASGPLYGTFFLELSATLGGDAAAAPGWARALDAAAAAVGRRGRSSTGEKTMLDALVPAGRAWHAAAEAGGTLRDCATAGSVAAGMGWRSTRDIVATKGRASYLGERSRGHLDPGAASAALILEALADAIVQVDGDGASR